MSAEKKDLREEFSRWGQKIKEFAGKTPAFIENSKNKFSHSRKDPLPRDEKSFGEEDSFGDEERYDLRTADDFERRRLRDDVSSERYGSASASAKRRKKRSQGSSFSGRFAEGLGKIRFEKPSFLRDSGKKTRRGTKPARQRGDAPVCIVIPAFLQTTVAVIVCCGVLFAAGFAIFSVEQYEISSLKSDLKTYSDNGVVPAESLDELLALNVDVLAGRVASLERWINLSDDTTLSGEDLQWVDAELSTIQEEARKMEILLNDVDAPSAVRTSFKDHVQSPLVTLAQTYEEVGLADEDVASTEVETGAANDTGEFKLANALRKTIRWTLIIILILAIFAVGYFLLRPRWADYLDKTGKGSGKGKNAVAGKKKERPKKAAHRKTAGKKKKTAAKKRKPAASPKAKEELNIPVAGEGFESGDGEESDASPVIPETEHDEEAHFYENFAPTMKKMAEEERTTAEEGTNMIDPDEDNLIAFDASVDSLDDIDEEEDLLFTDIEDDED